jgi:hypothetical protein
MQPAGSSRRAAGGYTRCLGHDLVKDLTRPGKLDQF